MFRHLPAISLIVKAQTVAEVSSTVDGSREPYQMRASPDAPPSAPISVGRGRAARRHPAGAFRRRSVTDAATAYPSAPSISIAD